MLPRQEQGSHAAGHASDDAGSAPGGQRAARAIGAAEELADHDQRHAQPEVRHQLDQRLRAGLAQGRRRDARHTEGGKEPEDATALPVVGRAGRPPFVEQAGEGEEQDGIAEGELLQHVAVTCAHGLTRWIAGELGERLRHGEQQHPQAQTRGRVQEDPRRGEEHGYGGDHRESE